MPDQATNLDRVEIPADSFLRTTGQVWKLGVSGVVLPWPAAALGWWFLRRMGPHQPAVETVVSIGTLAGIAASIALLLASVRCPQCSTRLLGRVIWAPEVSTRSPPC